MTLPTFSGLLCFCRNFTTKVMPESCIFMYSMLRFCTVYWCWTETSAIRVHVFRVKFLKVSRDERRPGGLVQHWHSTCVHSGMSVLNFKALATRGCDPMVYGPSICTKHDSADCSLHCTKVYLKVQTKRLETAVVCSGFVFIQHKTPPIGVYTRHTFACGYSP